MTILPEKKKDILKLQERQVAEAVAICRSNADYIMNSKAEFMQPTMERVIVEKN